jgi:hypothetical protein
VLLPGSWIQHELDDDQQQYFWIHEEAAYCGYYVYWLLCRKYVSKIAEI